MVEPGGRRVMLGVICVAGLLLAGCGSNAERQVPNQRQEAAAPSALSVKRTVTALHSLPYGYRLRHVKVPAGADAAVAGEATGPDRTHVQFGIALGSRARPVPVPVVGTSNVSFVPSAGFTFSDDLIVEVAPRQFRPGPNIHSQRQEDVAIEMVGRLEAALCLAATGKKCGI